MKNSLTSACLAMAFLAGCSTTSVQQEYLPKEERAKVAGDMQEVKLTSFPAGANCTVDRDGKQSGKLDLTPGFVTLKRSNFKSVDVTCTKPGYTPQTEKLRTIIGDKAIGGNIGAAITLFKMADGSYSSYEKSLFVKMMPEAFNSVQMRDDYIAEQLTILNAQYQADEKGIKPCKKQKKRCMKKRAKRLASLQQAYELKSSRMKAEAGNIGVKANTLPANTYVKTAGQYGKAMAVRCGAYRCETLLRKRCGGADYRIIDQETYNDYDNRKNTVTGEWDTTRTETVRTSFQCDIT